MQNFKNKLMSMLVQGDTWGILTFVFFIILNYMIIVIATAIVTVYSIQIFIITSFLSFFVDVLAFIFLYFFVLQSPPG